MFEGNIGDIDHDISVLAMDKILYDNGFPVTDSEIHSDSEYETFLTLCCIWTDILTRTKVMKQIVR